MAKRTMSFMKGTAAGVIAGVAVAAVGTMMVKDNKRLKKDANRAMHAVGSMVNDMRAG